MYKEAANNPSLPQEQKQLYAQKMAEQQDRQLSQQDQLARNQILNLQLYQQKPPPPKDKFGMAPVSFFPSYTPNPYLPPHLSAGMPFGYPMGFPNINVNKIYDINVGGPADSHQTLKMIYEDVLPAKHIKTSFINMGDRLTQMNYIRSILFPQGDGNDVGFTSNSKNNLLAHIKFLDLNPYNTYRFSDNPYKGLPDGFLLYRTCYPIQRSERDGIIMCSRNSTAVNLRIYKLTLGAFQINKQNKSNYTDFEQWREVAFYEYIRENIIKKKICPNFVSMIGFYTCEKSGIDFDKVTILKQYNKSNPSNQVNFNQNIYSKKLEKDKLNPINDDGTTMYTKKDSSVVLTPKSVVLPAIMGMPQYIDNKGPDCTDLNLYTGSVLAVMTESPTYNLYNWASKLYQIEGNIKRMVNTGFHTDNVWISLIFQLMVALYVMQINNLYIHDFSIRNNVFIKDLPTEANITSYWKYKINNIEYYIPNMGYLLLLDSNYSDIDANNDDSVFLNPDTSGNLREHKLNGLLFNKSLNVADVKYKCFEIFKTAIDSNNFKGDFISEGGTPPQQETLDLLTLIFNDATRPDAPTDINYYIMTYMRRYMNNRIGTYLKEQEYPHVRKDDMKSAHSGNIVVQDEGNGNNRFVLFLGVNNNVATIISKNDDLSDYIQADVPITSLYNYSRHESIVQTYKPNEANLTEEAIIETYNIISNT